MLELRISRKTEPIQLDEIAAFLAEQGIAATVWPCVSTCPRQRDTDQEIASGEVRKSGKIESLKVEYGVVAELHSCDKETFVRVWPLLREKFGFACGHVRERSRGFSGCTENYIRRSACPWSDATAGQDIASSFSLSSGAVER